MATKTIYGLAVVLIIGLGVARIVSTYHEFTQTVDENSDIASGMQLLQDRVYFMDVKHPPVGRIAVALGPYMEGLRLPKHGGDMFALGNVILNSNNKYWHNLALARFGTLPFFVLACVVVWAWSGHLFGNWAALFSLLLFTMIPAVLAHGSLATNDMAGAATLLLALYWFTLWMENPTWLTAARLGLGAGLAAASKFSALLFFPACATTLILLRVVAERDYLRKLSFRRLASNLLLTLVIAYFTLWAGYLFTMTPLQASRPHAAVDRVLGSHPVLHHAVLAILETPYPAGNVAAGLKALAGQNKAGQVSFFFGEWRRHGWWYFFPVIFLLKSPMPFLLLACVGSVFVMRSFAQEHDWRFVAPTLFALAILAVSMTSGINIGLRHILAIYPLLSIVAGHAVVGSRNIVQHPLFARGVVTGACLWLVLSSFRAHPDYLAYFNFVASDRPERIEVDSDLDWGQDLARLSKWLHARGVNEVALSYFGTADLTHADLPNFHELVPYQKVDGWIAISARYRVIPSPFVVQAAPPGMPLYYSVPGNFNKVRPGTGPFAWLSAYQPVERIGHSIFVYHIPPVAAEPSGSEAKADHHANHS
jgi:Dolichyl-phosphate-mannose-protein mannosyltransferase